MLNEIIKSLREEPDKWTFDGLRSTYKNKVEIVGLYQPKIQQPTECKLGFFEGHRLRMALNKARRKQVKQKFK